MALNDEPLIYNITCYRGQDFHFEFTYEEGDPAAAVNLTGYAANMDIFDNSLADTPLKSLSSGAGDISLSTNGTVAIVMTDTVTATLPKADVRDGYPAAYKGYYVTTLTRPDTTKTRVMQGEFIVVA